MAFGTIDGVLRELRAENHVPMVSFVDALARQEWAGKLSYDLSMLRLWIARKGVPHPEAMVIYADGRGGGRPSAPYVDAFELTFFVDSRPGEVSTQGSAATLERLRSWADSHER